MPLSSKSTLLGYMHWPVPWGYEKFASRVYIFKTFDQRCGLLITPMTYGMGKKTYISRCGTVQLFTKIASSYEIDEICKVNIEKLAQKQISPRYYQIHLLDILYKQYHIQIVLFLKKCKGITDNGVHVFIFHRFKNPKCFPGDKGVTRGQFE